MYAVQSLLLTTSLPYVRWWMIHFGVVKNNNNDSINLKFYRSFCHYWSSQNYLHKKKLSATEKIRHRIRSDDEIFVYANAEKKTQQKTTFIDCDVQCIPFGGEYFCIPKTIFDRREYRNWRRGNERKIKLFRNAGAIFFANEIIFRSIFFITTAAAKTYRCVCVWLKCMPNQLKCCSKLPLSNTAAPNFTWISHKKLQLGYVHYALKCKANCQFDLVTIFQKKRECAGARAKIITLIFNSSSKNSIVWNYIDLRCR